MTDDRPFDSRAKLISLPAPASGIAAWLAGLVRPAEETAALANLLSAAEHARADRFGTPELRDRYVTGRATLRTLLGRHLGVPPEAVTIERGRRGRPFAPMAPAVDFNISHTRDVALIAIATDVRIGVDIEHGERTLNVSGVSRKFMSPGEQEALGALAEDARRRRLLRLWTCKEAMSKATGDALSAPFRQLDVEVAPTLRLRDGPPPYVPAQWQLGSVAVPGGFLATIALWHRDVHG